MTKEAECLCFVGVDYSPHARLQTLRLRFPEGLFKMVYNLMGQQSNTHHPKMKPIKIIKITVVMTAAAAVVVIGLLMAPEKGINLKKKIKEGVHDWYDEFSRLLYTDL